MFVTVTGADESVDPGELLRAFRWIRPSRAELAFLWGGPEMEGRPRFPGLRWFRELYAAIDLAAAPPPRLALHLCKRAESQVAGWPGRGDSPASVVGMLGLPGGPRFTRFQMNRALGSGLAGKEEFDARRMSAAGAAMAKLAPAPGAPAPGFVIQVKRPTAAAVRNAAACLAGASRDAPAGVLLDASGGKGRLPEAWEGWPAPSPGFAVGFAGGLAPENLAGQLGAIQDAAGPGRPFWVDLETGARAADGSFSIDRALAAVEAGTAWESRREAENVV